MERDPRPPASPAARSELAPAWEWLYALVGGGMRAVSTARFDLEVVGGSFPRVAPGQLWISTHRAETDVPILGGLMYTRGGMWRPGAPRAHFAARDDLFEPGVVTAGLHLPAPIGRLVWPLSPGPWLPRVRAHPVRRPTGAKLGQLLAALPSATRLEDAFGPRVLHLVDDRTGSRRPTTVEALHDPAFAALLWEDVTGDDFVGDARAAWRGHVAHAAGDLRRLARILRDGEPLVLFPEGRVSPDGGLGPIGPMLATLARLGQVATIVPVALAYDPLRPRRPAVAVAAGPPLDCAAGDPVADVLGTLRRQTPVTCGQVVSRVLVRAAAAGEERISELMLRGELDVVARRASDCGRPVTAALRADRTREARVDAAIEALRARRCIVTVRGGSVRIDPQRTLGDTLVRRLATEDAAVWADDPPARSA